MEPTIINNKQLSSHSYWKIFLKKMSNARESLKNYKRETLNVRESGINYSGKTFKCKRKITVMPISFKDNENSSSKLFIKMKENYLKQIELSHGFNIKMIREQLLSIW